jgi:hypothetical protein
MSSKEKPKSNSKSPEPKEAKKDDKKKDDKKGRFLINL